MIAYAWLCFSYALFSLVTFVWIGVLTYREEHDAQTWLAWIACSVLWPAYWLGALCVFVTDMRLPGTEKREAEEPGGGQRGHKNGNTTQEAQ